METGKRFAMKVTELEKMRLQATFFVILEHLFSYLYEEIIVLHHYTPIYLTLKRYYVVCYMVCKSFILCSS